MLYILLFCAIVFVLLIFGIWYSERYDEKIRYNAFVFWPENMDYPVYCEKHGIKIERKHTLYRTHYDPITGECDEREIVLRLKCPVSGCLNEVVTQYTVIKCGYKWKRKLEEQTDDNEPFEQGYDDEQTLSVLTSNV